MKTIKITIAFLLAAILTTGADAQQAEQKDNNKQQLVVPLSEPGKPFKLNVGIINGSIKVTAYEGKDVVIDVTTEEADKKEKDRDRNRIRVNVNINGNEGSSSSSSGMKKINAGNGMDISAQEKSNTVTVHTESWKGPVNLTIKVPQTEATYKLSTINDGDIVVNNVNGEMEISNNNGAVQLNNVSGAAVVNALNHNIKATFKSVDPKAAMAFSSLNGNIDVTFPATYKANVKLKSDQGDMFTDFDIDADKTQPKPTQTTKGNTYRINIENWVYGKINGGGSELMMKNMNGNIYIRKAK